MNKETQAMQRIYDIAINAVGDHDEVALDHALNRIVGISSKELRVSTLEAVSQVEHEEQ